MKQSTLIADNIAARNLAAYDEDPMPRHGHNHANDCSCDFCDPEPDYDAEDALDKRFEKMLRDREAYRQRQAAKL